MSHYLTIEKADFKSKNIIKKIHKYLKGIDENKKTIIFDIHNTLEYGDNNVDDDILNFIKKNHKKTNIILLSYDGNDERIKTNYNKINSHSKIFTKIPVFFIKKRKKHHVIYYISKLTNKPILFVDDNYNNIKDATKIKKKVNDLEVIHYTKHVAKEKYNIGITNISKLLENFIN